jgi:predicted AAA+ superfamily ATPase
VIRRLEPVHANLSKRPVKSPKVWVRDGGLLHALLSTSRAPSSLLGFESLALSPAM